jgi:phage terminase small subunit
MKNEQQGEVVSFSSPRLTPLDKLYVRVYLSTLSHTKAYEQVNPGLKKYHEDNPFSRKENIKFHISLALQEKADALCLSPELIIEKLYKEATREGAGSNHAARIQALTQLGKHFGMFQEKKETNAHTFNIINYGTIESVESVEPLSLEENEPLSALPSNIILTDYS